MEGISEALRKQSYKIDFKKTKFLVVGGNGYFGYKLVEGLVGRGCPQVRVLDKHQSRFHGASQVEFMRGDMCDPETVAQACSGIDVVFHTASFFGNPPFSSQGDGTLEYNINVIGTKTVMDGAKQAGVSIFIYIGSSSSVFNGEREFYNESEDSGYPDKFVDHYGRCKAIAEQEVLKANSVSENFRTCVLRPNGIYGENEVMHIPRIRKMCALMGDTLLFYFDPSVVSDWTFVDNLTHACFLALEKIENGNNVVPGNVYTITDGETIDMMSFFGPIMAGMGVNVRGLFYVPFWLILFFAYILELFCHVIGFRTPYTRIEAMKICKTHYFSIKKANDQLSYFPIVSLKEGQQRTITYFSKYHARTISQK